MDKTQDALDLYFLTRNVVWRYELDQYEDATIAEMLKTVRSTVSEIKREIFDGDATANADALVAELEALSAGLRRKIGEDVATMSGVAAEYSATEHAAIMSLDGAVKINTVALSAAQFQSFLGGSNGGTPLPQWVDDAWGHVVSDKIRRNLNIAVLRGEGYQKAVRGLLDSSIADFTEREAVTIARTYVQTANVAAQAAVYAANDDIVKAWEWSAVLEPGFSKSGRGTCVRCQALDGRRFKLNEGPPIPLHARCRCQMRPVTVSWRELGIDRDEIEQAIRPYTIRPDVNIDAGGMRTIIESGRHQGDYASWWAKQPKEFQINAVGPGRYELLKSGKVQFGDLVDANGRQRTLKELMGGGAAPVPLSTTATAMTKTAAHPYTSFQSDLANRYGSDKIYSMATDAELEKLESLERDFYAAQKAAAELPQTSIKVQSIGGDKVYWSENNDVLEEIQAAMDKALDDDGADYFGMRVQTNLRDKFNDAYLKKRGIDVTKDVAVKVGDELPPSYVWVDNELTDEMLEGTSTILVKSGNRKSIEKAVKRLNEYTGREIVLVSGQDMMYGQDDGEAILKAAKVLKVWNRK